VDTERVADDFVRHGPNENSMGHQRGAALERWASSYYN
jgi:hypothetical protein